MRTRRTKVDALRRGALLAACACACAALLAPGAWGQEEEPLTNDENPFRASPEVWIYHSREGDGFYDFTTPLPIGRHVLGIWATGGATVTVEGPPTCAPDPEVEAGQDLCALDIEFQLANDSNLPGTPGRLIGFTATTGLMAGSFVNADGTRLRVNLTAGSTPLPAGFPPARIGSLELEMGAQVASVTVSGVEGVQALGPGQGSLAVASPVSPECGGAEVGCLMFIPVPEPGEYLLLLSGLLGLAGLHALRSWRRA